MLVENREEEELKYPDSAMRPAFNGLLHGENKTLKFKSKVLCDYDGVSLCAQRSQFFPG